MKQKREEYTNIIEVDASAIPQSVINDVAALVYKMLVRSEQEKET